MTHSIEYTSMAPFIENAKRIRELSEQDWIEGSDLRELLDQRDALVHEHLNIEQIVADYEQGNP